MAEQYRTVVDPAADNNPHAFAIRMVGSGHRVLEVGCSVGHVTEHLVAAGNDVVGVEIDAAAAAEARTKAREVHVVDLDVTELSSVTDERFDVIVLGDVLEHFREPGAVLADLVTLLDPGGRLVVSIPHVGFVDVRLMLLEGRWEYDDDGLLDRTHLRWFTRESLRQLLAGAGFVARRVERVRVGVGAGGLPVTPGLHAPQVVEFVLADPEATTYQFVVEAVRRDEDAGREVVDALAGDPVEFPDLAADRAELTAEVDRLRAELDAQARHNAALTAEVEAWRGSKLVRAAAPLRAVWARVKARRAR